MGCMLMRRDGVVANAGVLEGPSVPWQLRVFVLYSCRGSPAESTYHRKINEMEILRCGTMGYYCDSLIHAARLGAGVLRGIQGSQ